LEYSSSTSDTDHCSGLCDESLAANITNPKTIYSAYSRTATGSQTATVDFAVKNGITKPGTGQLSESGDTYSASGSYVNAGSQCGALSGSDTEVAKGGTTPGTIQVASLRVLTSSTGRNDLELDYNIPSVPNENTFVTPGKTTPCQIAPYPFTETQSYIDAQDVSQSLGLYDPNASCAGIGGCYQIRGWTINPDWTPETGGILATKMAAATTPQPPSEPGAGDTGTVSATQTWKLVTEPCTQAATSAYMASFRSGGQVCNHYTVEIRAWIPFSDVVDPLQPAPRLYLASQVPPLNVLSPNCYKPDVLDQGSTLVTSTLRGDGHASFEGSYRVVEEIQFNFDGHKISDFSETPIPHTAPSYRDKIYYLGPLSHHDVLGKCANTKTAPNGSSAAQTGDTTFTLSYERGVPLVPDSPDISQIVQGTVNDDGSIDLTYTVTNFPNQGIQVTNNGTVILTAVTNDVTCLPASKVHGYSGIALVFFGLNTTHAGSYHADPAAAASYDQPSQLCSGIWWK
jgi:hypothetical protein